MKIIKKAASPLVHNASHWHIPRLLNFVISEISGEISYIIKKAASPTVHNASHWHIPRLLNFVISEILGEISYIIKQRLCLDSLLVQP
jgi:hypothetical protein